MIRSFRAGDPSGKWTGRLVWIWPKAKQVESICSLNEDGWVHTSAWSQDPNRVSTCQLLTCFWSLLCLSCVRPRAPEEMRHVPPLCPLRQSRCRLTSWPGLEPPLRLINTATGQQGQRGASTQRAGWGPGRQPGFWFKSLLIIRIRGRNSGFQFYNSTYDPGKYLFIFIRFEELQGSPFKSIFCTKLFPRSTQARWRCSCFSSSVSSGLSWSWDLKKPPNMHLLFSFY